MNFAPQYVPERNDIGEILQKLTAGFVQGETERRSKKGIGSALDENLSPADQIQRLLTTPGISPEDRNQAIKSIENQSTVQIQQQKMISDLIKQQQKQALMDRLMGNVAPNEGDDVRTGLMEGQRMNGLSQQQMGGIAQQQMDGQKPTQQESSVNRFQPREISENEILAANLVDPQLGNLLSRRKDAASRVSEKIKDREFQIASKVLEKGDELRQELIQKKASLESMKDAIQEGNLGFFSKDNIAQMTGIEGFRTLKGAQFVAAGKEYFLGSLKRAGARPNQWIEQQIQKMLPTIGRSKEANLGVSEMLSSELAIEEKRLQLQDEIAAEHEEKYGFIRRSLGAEVEKRIKPFAELEQKKLENKLRDISKEYKPGKVPDGFELSRDKAAWYLRRAKNNPDKAREMALKDGHLIPGYGEE